MSTFKRTLSLAALATLGLFAACAPTKFDFPAGVTEAQFHRDNLDCAVLAKNFVGDNFVMGPPLMIAAAQIRQDRVFKATHDECMLGKSYSIHAE